MDSTVSQASALPRTGNTDFSSRVLTDMSTGVLVLSDTGVIRYVNPPAANMLELDMSRLPEGKHFHLITADRNNDEFSDYILHGPFWEKVHLSDVQLLPVARRLR